MDFSQAPDLFTLNFPSGCATAIRLLPELALAILVFVFFLFLSRWVSRGMVRGLHRVSHNQSIVNLTGAIVRALMVAVGLFIALGMLGLDKT